MAALTKGLIVTVVVVTVCDVKVLVVDEVVVLLVKLTVVEDEV